MQLSRNNFLQSILSSQPKLFSEKVVARVLICLVVLLALLAGFYHAQLESERKRYARLEDLYVRVRGELGREETQRLIDLSREKETLDYSE